MAKVINLFDSKKENEEEVEEKSSESLFAEIMQRNEDNRKRMMQERLRANKGVLRSYRMKR